MTVDTRFFSRDPLNGVTRLFHGYEDGGFTIEEVWDNEPVMEQNKALLNEYGGRKHGDGLSLVASIPMPLYMELVQKGITRDQAAMRRWLNDRDNQVFKVHEGKV